MTSPLARSSAREDARRVLEIEIGPAERDDFRAPRGALDQRRDDLARAAGDDDAHLAHSKASTRSRRRGQLRSRAFA